MKKLFFCITLLLICKVLAFSQDKAEPYKKWELGINAGVASFTGEYNMYKEARFNHFNHWKSDMVFDYGALAKKNFSHIFALEVAWNYSYLSGSWIYDTRRIRDFKTQVIQTDLNSVWNMNNLLSKNKFDRKIYWYAKLGFGISHIWRIEGVTRIFHDQQWKPTFPLGAGVSFRLFNHVKLNVGTLWSWINTDRLDGMKTEVIVKDPGNTEADVFGTKLYTHVGIAYNFGRKRKPRPVSVGTQPQPTQQPQPRPQPQPQPKQEPKQELKPEVKAVQPAVIGNVYKVYFGFDKWEINSQTSADLDRLAKDMNENPSVNVVIKSHTDSRGPASYNMKLSEKRGKSVIDYLAGKGVSASRINAQAFGETQPVNKCKDGVPCSKAEYALNRRTETIIIE
jgi:outer membrane protein OmpA-like peptidoglycan-associated protein